MPIWTEHKVKQAKLMLENCGGDSEKAASYLRRIWKKPVIASDFDHLTLKPVEQGKQNFKAERAWQEYTPTPRSYPTKIALTKPTSSEYEVVIPDVHHPYVNK